MSELHKQNNLKSMRPRKGTVRIINSRKIIADCEQSIDDIMADCENFSHPKHRTYIEKKLLKLNAVRPMYFESIRDFLSRRDQFKYLESRLLNKMKGFQIYECFHSVEQLEPL